MRLLLLLALAFPLVASDPAAEAPASAAPAASPSTDRVAALFARGLEVQESLLSIRAHFTETTRSSLLREPLVASGTVVAVKPGRLRLDYTVPEKKTVVIDGDRLVVVWPDRDEGEVLDIGRTQKRIDRHFTGASVADLRRMFAIEVSDDPEMPVTYRVTMTPRKKPIRVGIVRLDIWVDHETLLIQRMTMAFPEGDEKRLDLSAIERNVEVSPAVFDVKVPAGKAARGGHGDRGRR